MSGRNGKRKAAVLVIAALLLLLSSLISPAFCTVTMTCRTTVTLTAAASNVPNAEIQQQMQQLAALLAEYITTVEHAFTPLYVVNADAFFNHNGGFITDLANLAVGAYTYKNRGTVTSTDVYFGKDYQNALKHDRVTSDYYNRYSWQITFSPAGAAIRVDELAAPKTGYSCTAADPRNGTFTTGGSPAEQPAQGILLDTPFIQVGVK